jgi:hypothetical protein
MKISDLEHLEIVSKQTNSNEINQVNGGIALGAFAFSFVQASNTALAFTRTGAVAIALGFGSGPR